ncbi:adenosylcobinamide-GDP ribazoletransferase [Primorskyibacter sedentarius]|uniref:adenosylcobinamide-GDP ribazoletransferase n=1 Tax=Primorskyibacter sedentarius TaxID=745311 RepID=UPI003EB707C5
MVDRRDSFHPHPEQPALPLELHLFLLALRYLTHLPVPRDLPSSDDLMIRATKYYPAVGLVIGGVSATLLWLLAQLIPMPVAVLVSMGLTMLLTGAFHEDGLADAADALGGGATRRDVLKILRDSRLGTYGALSLAMVLAIKAACLMALPLWAACSALVAGHALSRMGIVQVIAATQYAPHEGSKYRPPGVTPDGYRFALVSAVVLALVMVPIFGLWAQATAIVMSFLAMSGFAQSFLRKLSGYTLECLGGCQQFAELGFYIGLVMWL